MEDMIKKIIEIDQKALKKKQDTERIIKENEKRLKERYSIMEKDTIQKAKVEAERKFQLEMEKCNTIINNIKHRGDNEINLLQNNFYKIHQELSKSLFSEIFELL